MLPHEPTDKQEGILQQHDHDVANPVSVMGWIKHDELAALFHEATVTYPNMRTQVRPYVLSVASERGLKPGDTFKECAKDAHCPEMVVVPAGSFTMGSPATEPGHQPTEEPQHTVTLAKPFAVSIYELTFAEWDTCVVYGDCDPNIDDRGWGRG